MKQLDKMLGRLPAMLALLLLCILPGAPAVAIDAGSDGSDGTFYPVKGSPPWDADNDGIVTLRPEMFSISDGRNFDARNGIFNWTDVDIPATMTVVFSRDRLTSSTPNPPIHFLSQNNILVAGTIKSDGKPYGGLGSGAGGPGGFDGSPNGVRFMGPVTSSYTGSNEGLPPNGGAGDQQGIGVFAAGGAGAYTLAANNTITLSTGSILRAVGADNNVNFDPGGGGGSIRLVADTIVHNATITAVNGQGGFTGFLNYGPVRLEAFTLSGSGTTHGNLSIGGPGPVLYESDPIEPRLFIDRLVDNVGTELAMPDWDPADPTVYMPVFLPKTLVAPFTVVVRAENIAAGQQVRIIAPATTRLATLAFNGTTGQMEASALFNGASDFGLIEEINTIYAELVVP